LFISNVFAVEIKIQPVVQGESYYIMQLGETQAFEASGFGWDENKQEETSGKEIKEIQWSFDTRFLELVGKAGNTITLKAIKKRTSKLTVTAKIDNEDVTKEIFIVVR
ncbi:MAG: hypothetical protein WC658_03205, partial [Candidatus Omnitrophota bacterium]